MIRSIASNGVPTVMVISAFYDLKEVQSGLSDFLSTHGYAALFSEHNLIPADPDADTIENCRRRVALEVDALVLIIGGGYGAVDDRSMKSVNNIEYDAARVKGIPVFVNSLNSQVI